MSKDRRQTKDQPARSQASQAEPAEQSRMEFGSNAERYEYVMGLQNADEVMAEQMNAGLPDAELGILLIEAASTGALAEFHDNDAWKATATTNFTDRQLDRWDNAMTVVSRVDELMTGALRGNPEFDAAVADWKTRAEDRATSLANDLANSGRLDLGEAESSSGCLDARPFEGMFNGTNEKFSVWSSHESSAMLTREDKGSLWTERTWDVTVDGDLSVIRLDQPHEISTEVTGRLTITSYTNDFASTGMSTVDNAEWSELSFG